MTAGTARPGRGDLDGGPGIAGTASWGFAASTGLDFTRATIVDAHFEACRPTYRALLDRAGFRPGSHLLDVGCGSGAFLPWLAGLAGPDGRVTALDLAPENVELAVARTADAPCPVTVDQGDLLRLPYPDNAFDAAWSANTVQYLDDAALTTALAELRRVVRPGGPIVVKELDPTGIRLSPGDPFLFTTFFQQAARVPGYARQLVRARELHRWFRAGGLRDVRQEFLLSEHFGPLSEVELAYYGRASARIADQARRLSLPGAWEPLLDPAGPANPLRDASAYISEGNVLVRGTVPG
jgi:ubiquinone/menaquinone biosynthesis C-methylase UbiE